MMNEEVRQAQHYALRVAGSSGPFSQNGTAVPRVVSGLDRMEHLKTK